MNRSCGVLLPISALPCEYGIGTFGRAAYDFVDFLKRSGQEYWQILPLVPTGAGDSPYSSFSTFAGNPYFIDLVSLTECGLLQKEECDAVEWSKAADTIDYETLYQERIPLLRTAFARSDYKNDTHYGSFKEKNAYWLDDFALFMAVKDAHDQKGWQEWETPIRLRQPEALCHDRLHLAEEIEFWSYIQYLFFTQYSKLKAYANGNGIKIIGDMPICVAADSADVWANSQIFRLDADLNPVAVAGVPPDYFSRTGQLWGNPVYDWEGHRQELFEWWRLRLSASFELYDYIRIDHFRAFDEYYAIPFGAQTAVSGTWEKGPGIAFFQYMEKQFDSLPIIAEDLGGITDTVRKLLKDTGFPGMKVLQFGFNAEDDSLDLPHHYEANQIAYTGTHDNDTLVGWFDSANKTDRQFAMDYLRIQSADEFADAMIQALYASAANLTIVPIQDFLGLGSEARMNIPSTVGINWKWRLSADALTERLADRIYHMAVTYRRNDGWKKPRICADKIIETLESRLYDESHTCLEDADTVTVYQCLCDTVMHAIYPSWRNTQNAAQQHKQACYLSAEFLIGRLVYNNLYCLGILDRVKDTLQAKGFDLNRFEDIEDDALGNGGLGRLAACFLDSAATHNLPLRGYGIRYKYGLFRQKFVDGFQTELPDDWTAQGDPWSIRRDDEKVTIHYADQTVLAVPYDMPVIGYGTNCVGTLRLWQSEAVHNFDFKLFNDQKYEDAVKERNDAERISMVVYPNDDTVNGKILRIKQEYLLSSASLQDILRSFKQLHGCDFERVPEYFAVQLNDTHPVMAIPELIRLLINEGLSFDQAFAIAQKCFAYTNHTVMTEALEKWDYSLFKRVIPQIAKIISQINKTFLSQVRKKHYSADEINKMEIVNGKTIHIANLAVYACFAVNGVAQIHSDILKKSLFQEWYRFAPDKFQNKTNGITQRRWLGLCNPELSGLITGLIGDSWKTDLDSLKNLESYSDDAGVIRSFREIKARKKQQLSEYISAHEGVALDNRFIFDVQAKRLHEYKRQLLNAFSIVDLYFKLCEGKLPDFNPTVFIFGAKAAPGYARAKGIIKYINEIARVVNHDPRVADKLKVVFIQNYNVSYAEKLMPAADISEQISTAGTEASGTGNMKFMLNGAVTLGTCDGANIEIFEQAGVENNYAFGAHVEELNEIRDSYDPKELYHADENLKRVVDTLIDGTFDDGGSGIFKELYLSLLEGASWHRPDHYFILKDFNDYMNQKLAANACFANEAEFARKCWLNMANSGKFSSDRTILEYAKDIWDIDKLKLS